MPNFLDKQTTIIALATPPGRGGVAILRLSGPNAYHIATQISRTELTPRYAHYRNLIGHDDAVIDVGVLLYFKAPHSFTGEDVVEIHCHGGPFIVDTLTKTALTLGAVNARPGEFSERAFLNDKIDLTQAEAIADLIDAESSDAATAAVKSLQGEFSNRIQTLVDQLIELRMHVEAAIDFPEEEIDFLSDKRITLALDQMLTSLIDIKSAAATGRRLREGMSVVIVGKPNAGKSSLLNALSGIDSAIVTPIAGTTRDVLREHIIIDGFPLHLIDTAGLRESLDEIEKIGISRARDELQNAELALLIIDSSEINTIEAIDTMIDQLQLSHLHCPITVILNKIDLIHESPSITSFNDKIVIKLSVKTGDGITLLKDHLKNSMGVKSEFSGVFSARRRHLDAIEKAHQAVIQGYEQLTLHKAGELLALELRQAQQYLGEITGEFTTDDLLTKIFSSFCIGK